MSPRRSERLRKIREANTADTTATPERCAASRRCAAARRSAATGRSAAQRRSSATVRSGAVGRRTVLRVPQCNMREPRRTGRRQLTRNAPVEAPFPPIPIPIEMRSNLQSNGNNNNNNNNSSIGAPNNISGENQNDELRRSLISLVIRIAVTESPSLPELARRNPTQGMRKLFRIIRFLFYRR